jgi:hypothetical protein
MRVRATAVLCLIAVGLLLIAPVADALEPGVHVNPRSPSGTEYSFPLGSTRQQMGGHSAAGASAGSGPLFGVGLHRHRGTGQGAAKGSRGGGRSGGHAARHGAGAAGHPTARGDAGAALRRQRDQAVAELEQGGSDSGAIGLVVGVMAIGGAGGLAMWWLARRRRAERE